MSDGRAERVAVRGLKLHVRRWDGDGIPFVLVHGLASNARTWDVVARELHAAGHPVVAVDGGLESLVPALAGRVRTARLQMLATAPTGQVAVAQPVYRRGGFDYWQQRPDGTVVVGGQRDHFEAAEWIDGGRAAAPEPTAEVQAALDDLLRTVVGVTDAAVTHRWAGSSAFTIDHRPICEPVGDGVVAVGGYSGTGNVIGPLCGRAAVQLLLTGTSALAATLLA